MADWFDKKSTHVVKIGDGKPPFQLDLFDETRELERALSAEEKKNGKEQTKSEEGGKG